MDEELNGLRDRIGKLSVEALRRGGEPMLDRVEAQLGVALRHSERLSQGTIQFTSTIKREMEESISRAEHFLDVNARPLVGI